MAVNKFIYMILLAAVFLELNPSRAAGLSSWQLTSAYPANADRQSCVAYNSIVYCIAGINYNSVYYASLSSAGVGSWQSSTPYPINTFDPSCVAYNGFAYCVGGGSAQIGFSNSVYYASLSNTGVSTWLPTNSYPLGNGIGYQNCVTSNGLIYCIAGDAGGSDTNSVYYASLSNTGVSTWQSSNTYPLDVQTQSCVAYNGIAYCMGGYDGSTALDVNSVYYASLSNTGVSTWLPTNAFPSERETLSCVPYNGFVYCTGAHVPVYYSQLSGSGLGSWLSTSPYPVAIDYPGCVAFNGFVYCVAGYDDGISLDTTSVYYASVNPTRASCTDFKPVSSSNTRCRRYDNLHCDSNRRSFSIHIQLSDSQCSDWNRSE